MGFFWLPFDEKRDLPFMKKWAKDWSIGYEFDPSYLPPTGVTIFGDAYPYSPVAVGFLILCDNKMAITSDVIADKKIDKKTRNEAVKYLLETRLQMARVKGYDFIIGYVGEEKRIKGLVEQGFDPIQKNLTCLVRSLWHLQR